MQIRRLQMGGQYKLKGGIVNFPVDVDTNVSILPRTEDNLYTIPIQLMKRMQDKNPYAFETVRPNKILLAAKYLVEQPLYKSHNISLSENWSSTHGKKLIENNIKSNLNTTENETKNAKTESNSINKTPKNDIQQETKDIEDYFDILPIELSIDDKFKNDNNSEPIENGLIEETLLQNEYEHEVQALRFAPGENKRPLGILFDQDFRELSNPSIRCGQKLNTKISLSKIIKSEFRRFDRRAANDKTYMFTNYDLLRKKN